ncbi:MAG: aminoacyl-tRNA hydrolase [Gemmatimonadetes bacterium]|nr:aminoacyl-tRNA hydrolase [Gemmatimonadota bacterium]
MTDAPADTIRIDDSLAVPAAELRYRASRASGPGGQHVNKASTRVELTWDVGSSPALSDEQRARLLLKLANRIDAEGVLHLFEEGSRSQYQNRKAVTERFSEVVAAALRVPKSRKRTRPPRAAKEARLQAKKHRAAVKRRRGRVEPDE